MESAKRNLSFLIPLRSLTEPRIIYSNVNPGVGVVASQSADTLANDVHDINIISSWVIISFLSSPGRDIIFLSSIQRFSKFVSHLPVSAACRHGRRPATFSQDHTLILKVQIFHKRMKIGRAHV